MKKRILSVFIVFSIVWTSIAVLTGCDSSESNSVSESTSEDNLSKIVDYTDMDRFVADTILCETEYNPSWKIAYPDDDRSWTYKQMTEVYMEMDSIISGAKNALGGSEFWFGVKKAIDGEFGELAVGWKMLMYTGLLMDYLTYNGETEEFQSNFEAVTSKYISQMTSEILQPMDYDDATEALKQMAPTEAVQFLKDNRYYEFLSDFNSILFDTIVDSAETAFDVIENTSRALALKDAEEGRVKFLNSIKEVSDDEDLKKAVDFVLEKYEMACNELTRDELALNEKTYTLCNSLTKKSWDLICSSIPGVGTVFKGIKLGEAGLNWLFNSEDNETNKMQLYIMYDFNEDAQNAFSKIRDTYISDSTTENAKIFNNSTCAYYNMQSYITTIADKYLAESLFNGAYNEFVNAFSNNNELSYNQMNSLLSHDIKYCNDTCKQVAKWYGSYKTLSESNSDKEDSTESTTTVENSSSNDYPKTISASNLYQLGECAYVSSYEDEWTFLSYNLYIAEDLEDVGVLNINQDKNRVEFRKIESYDDDLCTTTECIASETYFILDDSDQILINMYDYDQNCFYGINEQFIVDTYYSEIGIVNFIPKGTHSAGNLNRPLSLLPLQEIDWSTVEMKKASNGHSYITFKLIKSQYVP